MLPVSGKAGVPSSLMAPHAQLIAPALLHQLFSIQAKDEGDVIGRPWLAQLVHCQEPQALSQVL